MPGKEFKIIIQKMLRELKRTHKQFNEIRKTIQEQNDRFNKETKNNPIHKSIKNNKILKE